MASRSFSWMLDAELGLDGYHATAADESPPCATAPCATAPCATAGESPQESAEQQRESAVQQLESAEQQECAVQQLAQQVRATVVAHHQRVCAVMDRITAHADSLPALKPGLLEIVTMTVLANLNLALSFKTLEDKKDRCETFKLLDLRKNRWDPPLKACIDRSACLITPSPVARTQSRGQSAA